MTESQRRSKEFAQALSDELAQIWREGAKRVDRPRIEEIGQRVGLDRGETYEAFEALRGDTWRGDFVESDEGPGWEAVLLTDIPPPDLPLTWVYKRSANIITGLGFLLQELWPCSRLSHPRSFRKDSLPAAEALSVNGQLRLAQAGRTLSIACSGVPTLHIKVRLAETLSIHSFRVANRTWLRFHARLPEGIREVRFERVAAG